MNPAVIAQLVIILAPLIKEAVVEGGKLITTFRDDITQEDINKALEASKSVGWPALDFAPASSK
jgi:hypothetical protein